jgi:hypothetical protein
MGLFCFLSLVRDCRKTALRQQVVRSGRASPARHREAEKAGGDAAQLSKLDLIRSESPVYRGRW